jgi:ACS family glucarate transporter-like MFS transporter
MPSKEQIGPHFQRRIALFLFLLSFVTYLDRVNISIAGAPISRQFGFSHVKLGTIFSAFVLGYTLFQIPAGWLGDRFGHTRVLIVALFCWSAFTGLTAWAGRGFLVRLVGVTAAFCLVRFLIGVGEAATYPCANGIIASWFGPDERASVNDLMYAGVGVGNAVTPPLIAAIMLRFGWESAFYISAVVGIFLALAFWLGMPLRNPSCRGEVMPLPQGRAQESSWQEVPGAPATRPDLWKQLITNSQIWLLTIGMIMLGYIFYVYYFRFYTYLFDIRGFSLLRSSIATSMPFLAMAICAPAGGRSSDRLIHRIGRVSARRYVAMTGLISAACFIPAGAVVRNPFLAVAFLSLGAGSVYLTVSCFFATGLEVVNTHSSIVSGIINMRANLGRVI